jgi:hypothetical protein
MQKRSRKLPRDMNQLGKGIVDIATSNARLFPDADTGKDPAAVVLGRKGGKARVAKMTKKQRSEAAKKTARARWSGS